MKLDKVIVRRTEGREEIFHLFAQVAEKMLQEQENLRVDEEPKLLQ